MNKLTAASVIEIRRRYFSLRATHGAAPAFRTIVEEHHANDDEALIEQIENALVRATWDFLPMQDDERRHFAALAKRHPRAHIPTPPEPPPQPAPPVKTPPPKKRKMASKGQMRALRRLYDLAVKIGRGPQFLEAVRAAKEKTKDMAPIKSSDSTHNLVKIRNRWNKELAQKSKPVEQSTKTAGILGHELPKNPCTKIVSRSTDRPHLGHEGHGFPICP